MTTPRFALFAVLTCALAAPLVPALTVPTFAQASAPHGDLMQDPVAALGLSPAQKARGDVLMRKADQQMRVLSANHSLTPAAHRAKMRVIFQGLHTQMMAMLTPAQRVKASALAQQEAQAMRQQHIQVIR